MISAGRAMQTPKRKLRFLDETLRNAQQSLWATRMRTSSMLPIAPVMEAAGFYTICVAAGVSFEIAAMHLFEDPWERMRLLRQQMPKTRFDVLVRARVLWGWKAQPYDVQSLYLKTLLRNGVDGIKVLDGLNDLRNMAYLIQEGKRLGINVKGFLGYNDTPAYTDEYLARKAKEFSDHGVDGLVLTDSAGVMRPARTGSGLVAIRKAVGDLELHFHCHTTTGQAKDACRAAMRAGVDVIATAARPLAYGASLPSTLDIMRMAREEGMDPDLDERAVEEIDDWFYWVAHEEGRSVPEDKPFDPAFYQRYVGHQIPGGMISNLEKQLQDLHLEHRLSEVLEEAGRIRAELGYPRMATPYSQFVGVQAVLNVMDGQRYKTVPDSIRLYARGAFGTPILPIEPTVLDILVGDAPPIDPLEGLDELVLPKVRSEHGPFESDEDLLLFLFMNPAAYNNFKKNRKPITWNPRRCPATALVRALASRNDLASVEIERGPLKLSLSGQLSRG